MYVNKQLTDKKGNHRNEQGLWYTEIIPAHYVVVIKDLSGKWAYTFKIWRWDINHLHARDLMTASTERFSSYEAAIKAGVEAYRRIDRGGDHA